MPGLASETGSIRDAYRSICEMVLISSRTEKRYVRNSVTFLPHLANSTSKTSPLRTFAGLAIVTTKSRPWSFSQRCQTSTYDTPSRSAFRGA
jgi:hypothetical protein